MPVVHPVLYYRPLLEEFIACILVETVIFPSVYNGLMEEAS